VTLFRHDKHPDTHYCDECSPPGERDADRKAGLKPWSGDRFAEVRQLAHDCVTMTLHGPLPMKTVAKICQGVMDLYDEFVEPKTTVTYRVPGGKEVEDVGVAVRAWSDEAHALATRVRELEARIAGMV